MAAAIRFALSNFTLTLLVVGIVAALASLTRVPKATAQEAFRLAAGKLPLPTKLVSREDNTGV